MTYSICLDQFSTNFDVNNLSSNGFSIYTDLDFINPIASQIPYQDLFSPPIGNCPLNVNVPQGATQLLVIDNCTTFPTNIAPIFSNTSTGAESLIISCCYALINLPAQPISWCDTADLNFDVFSSSYISQIVAGNLNSALGAVTDYTIGWYKNQNYSSPVFTSGYGNAFTPYQLTHPLAGNTSPYVTAGNWEGIIHDIAINGVTYSSISGSAGGLPIPFVSCFGTIVVAPLSCGNGTFPLPYTHEKSFTAAGNGATPPVIAATYNLSSTTNYFAYDFTGYSVWDELEIQFISGDPNNTGNPSLYSQPIYLEKAQIGNDSPSTIYNTSLILDNTYPKKINNSTYKRILTLTNISRSANPSLPDRLDIKISPNPTNNQTSWKLKMQCLDTFNCEDCVEPFPAIKINNLFLDRLCCGTQLPLVTYSGSCDCGTNIWKARKLTSNPDTYGEGYTMGTSGLAIDFIPTGNLLTKYTNPFSSNSTPSCGGAYYNMTTICSPPTPNSIINYHKSTTTVNGNLQGIISMSFNNSTDYLHYKNQLISVESSINNAIGPIEYNPTIPEFYSYYKLQFPSTDIACGDGVPFVNYDISRTAYSNILYVENPSNNYWSITIPMPTIINAIPIVNCSSCHINVELIVTSINISSLSTPGVSVTNNYGSKLSNPWTYGYTNTSTPTISNTALSYIGSWNRVMPYYSWNTLPFISSSNGWVNLPTLNINPCPTLVPSTMPLVSNFGNASYWNSYPNDGFYNVGTEEGFLMYFPNLSASSEWFQVYTMATSSLGGPYDIYNPIPGQMIYQYSASIGTVYSSSYFVNGSPTVVIDPFPNC